MMRGRRKFIGVRRIRGMGDMRAGRGDRFEILIRKVW